MHYKAIHGIITWTEYKEYCVTRRGFKNRFDYWDSLSKKHGYNNYKEWLNDINHKSGKHKSMIDNKECTMWLGYHIAERLLSKIFKNVERMPYNHPGYDFICDKGYKINVKTSCLLKHKNRNGMFWCFSIGNNKDVDYFMLLAFDNRKDLNPIHIWLIKGDEVLITRNTSKKLNERYSITIYPTQELKYNKYEQISKLERLINCCNILKKVQQ